MQFCFYIVSLSRSPSRTARVGQFEARASECRTCGAGIYCVFLQLLGPTEAPKPVIPTTKRPTLGERVRDSAMNAIKNVQSAISQVPSRISGFFTTLNRGTQELLGPRNRTRAKPPSSPLLTAAAQLQNSILNPMQLLAPKNPAPAPKTE